MSVSSGRRFVLKRNLLALYLAALAFTAPAHAESSTGKASYYGLKGRTASGGGVGAFTAAHRSLPLGSKARVTNLNNHKSVEVTINDRGPFTGGAASSTSRPRRQGVGLPLGGRGDGQSRIIALISIGLHRISNGRS